MTTIDLSDYNGNMPGDSGYNLIGAEVKFIGEEAGLKVQYFPKHGIRAVKSLCEHLTEGEVARFHQARERFNAEIAVAIASVAIA
ncbi:hypothetical protein CEE44_04995 [Candidatus Woesearchaeota archaeon B3_Woes]|nr:MAG: hypothetical protein CEE44_04995 [Candidatus Woesearchaeota archaeon B3_Woes]